MAPSRTQSRGFSLIETIAAIVILSVALPAMLWTVGEAHVQRVNPMLLSTARWLAVEKLEDVIADRHSTTRGYAYLVTGNYPAENPVAGYPAFTRSVSFNETLAEAGTVFEWEDVVAGDGGNDGRSGSAHPGARLNQSRTNERKLFRGGVLNLTASNRGANLGQRLIRRHVSAFMLGKY